MSTNNEPVVLTHNGIQYINTKNHQPNVQTVLGAKDSVIDCEINHTTFGWIPTTISKLEKPDVYQFLVDNLTP